MTSVRIGDKSVLIDGKPVFLRSGEIAYYRTDPATWSARLAAASEANLNCVSTYIPWFWHEPQEGLIDLEGSTHPQRNLVSFLESVKQSGLYLIARPGPFINSEFRYGGHPAWVFENHPEVWSRDSEGRPAIWRGHGLPVPSQLHPKFLELVDRWYERVVPLLALFTAAEGGPIILSQPDNEMNLCFTYGLSGSLYDEHSIGGAGRPGLWHQWLLERHGSLEAVARRYAITASNLAEIQPPRAPGSSLADRLKIVDWLDYKTWYIFTYAARLVDKFRQLGLNVPFTLNEPVNGLFTIGGGDHAAASEFFRKEEGQFFTTGHIYMTGGEQDLLGVPTTLYRLEIMRLMDSPGPMFAAELGSGWVDLTRNRAQYNFDLLTRLALGHGLDGYNIFMFSGGTNPPGSNVYGADYHWNAPVLPDGTRHATYARLQRLGAWIKAWEPQLVGTEKEIDFYLGMSTDLLRQARWMDKATVLNPASEDMLNHATLATAASHDACDGIAGLIAVVTEFNAHFRFVNLSFPPSQGLNDRPLIIATGGVLPRAALDVIKTHVARGQSVMFFPTIPRLDTDGTEIGEFLRWAGLDGVVEEDVPTPGMDAHQTRFLAVAGAGIREVAVDRGVRCYGNIGKADILATYDGKPVVFRKPIGPGNVLVMGLYPSYLTRDSQTFFRSILLDETGITRRAQTTSDRLHAVVRRRPDSRSALVTVANIAGGVGTGRVTLRLDGHPEFVFPRLSELSVDPKSIFSYWINVDLGHSLLIYSSTELYPTRPDMKAFAARGDRLASVELAFDRPMRGTWNGEPFETADYSGLHAVLLRHHDGEAQLTLEPR